MAEVNLDGFGYNESEAVTGNKTLDAGDSGVVQNVTATCTITLPAAGATTSGVTYPIRVGAEGITVTISPNSADKIVGNGFTAADDKDMIFTNQPIGSYTVLQAVNEATTDSAYVVQRVKGTATRQA
jgi:hypothetical protein